ncbi:hypothetical protein BH11MYX3_BH11MYX3_12050 [soil metagenome]
MRATACLILALAQLSGGTAKITPPTRDVPWLRGFDETTSTEGEPGTAAPLIDEVLCQASLEPPLRITADVAPAAGRETVTATLEGGIHVVGAEGIELASSPGYPCEGSADALELLAAGSIFRDRVIVLAFTTGGRREQMTWLGVYRVGFGGDIDALFAGVVEVREDGVVRSGAVTFLPGALIYRPPGHHDSLWIYDPVVHTYTPRGPFAHEAEPHS